MSKKASTDLYDLIQNLNASEKRYFKLYIQRHFNNHNKGLKLFEFIEKMETYDEAKVLKKFKKEAFIKKLSITKSRLYDQILSSLHAYHLSKSVEAQLYKQLHGIEILFEKALYDQCEKMIRSARRQAEKNECFEILILIDNWEKKLIENSGFHIEYGDLQDKMEQHENYLERIQTSNAIWKYKSELFFQLNHKKAVDTEAEQKKVRRILKNSFSIMPKSNGERFKLNHLKSACYFSLGELINCSDYLQKNYELLLSNKTMVENDPASFLSTSTNLIYTRIKLSDFEKAHQLLSDLKQFKSMFEMDWNSDLDIKWFSSLKSIELNYRIEKKDIPGLQELIESLDRDLMHYRTKLSPLRLSYFLFQKSGVEIRLGEPGKALKTINELLNNPSLEQRQDIYTYSRVLETVAQYDAQKTELLPYTIRSLQRFLKNREGEFEFEKVFLKYLLKAVKAPSAHEKADVWLSLLEYIEQEGLQFTLKSHPYFDFLPWIQSRAQGKSMLDVA